MIRAIIATVVATAGIIGTGLITYQLYIRAATIAEATTVLAPYTNDTNFNESNQINARPQGNRYELTAIEEDGECKLETKIRNPPNPRITEKHAISVFYSTNTGECRVGKTERYLNCIALDD